MRLECWIWEIHFVEMVWTLKEVCSVFAVVQYIPSVPSSTLKAGKKAKEALQDDNCLNVKVALGCRLLETDALEGITVKSE